MAFDYKYLLCLNFIFCLFLSITHQTNGVSSLSSSTEPSNRSLLAKLQAMEKSALAKKLEGAGLPAKEKSVLAKALKGTELKAVEKSVLDKAMKEAGLQELEKSALTKAMKGASKNFVSVRNFGDESVPEKNHSKSEIVLDIKTSTPEAEITILSLSNLTTLQLLDNESFYISHLLNKSLALEKDMHRNETDDSNSTVLTPTETVNISSIADLLNETVDSSVLLYPQNETQNTTSSSNLQKAVLDNSSVSPLDLDLKGTNLNKINLDNENTNSTVQPHGHIKLEKNLTETSKNLNATERKVKHSGDKKSYREMEIKFGDKKLKIHVHDIDSWLYLPDAAVSVISHNTMDVVERINLMKLKDLGVYEGNIKSDTKAHVLGSILNGLFSGYIFTDQGKLLYVNNSSVMSTDIFNATHIKHGNCNDSDELCHELSLLKTFDCIHEGQYGIACFLGERKDLNDTCFKENSTRR